MSQAANSHAISHSSNVQVYRSDARHAQPPGALSANLVLDEKHGWRSRHQTKHHGRVSRSYLQWQFSSSLAFAAGRSVARPDCVWHLHRANRPTEVVSLANRQRATSPQADLASFLKYLCPYTDVQLRPVEMQSAPFQRLLRGSASVC